MDEVLKQRLIGAAVLIALAVIFIPMFFGGSDDALPPARLDPAMPTSPIAEREVRRLPLNPNRASVTESQAGTEQVELPVPVTTPSPDDSATERVPLNPSASTSGTSGSEAVVDVQPEEALVSVPAENDASEQATRPDVVATPTSPGPEPKTDAAKTDGVGVADASVGWSVQVASFSAQATAKRVADALQAAGHAVEVERIVRGQSVLYRVSTGPYENRQQAEDARESIENTTEGVSPVVKAPIMGGEASVDIEPGYAVQVGSFTSGENADRLESRLRSENLNAFVVVEQVGGRSIWRVRVGTVSTREAAEALQARLKQELSLEGLVVSHP